MNKSSFLAAVVFTTSLLAVTVPGTASAAYCKDRGPNGTTSCGSGDTAYCTVWRNNVLIWKGYCAEKPDNL